MVDPIVASIVARETGARETAGEEEPSISYTSDSYQKILDYHIVEIFLTTLVLGVIALLRHHH